jgi:predicted ATPase/DNA-binding SARP family transcriptional activator
MPSFRVLGPVEAWAGDQPIVLGGGRQLKLFAFLVLHANRAVSADAVIDAVWGPERDGAVKRLHMGIARLRKALQPLDTDRGSVLRTVSGGYLLSVAPGELDADAFADQLLEGRRALAEGDPAGASVLLGEALALWRGAPLADVAFEEFAQAEIRRLEELRLSALETRVDADLQLGRHRELIAELETLFAGQPTHEGFAGQLMTAFYRSGRQGEALEVYQRTRVQLTEQLGLEPGPALKALQTQILEHASELSTGGSSVDGSEPDHNLPALASSFVGRERELAELRDLVAQSRVVTLTGAGGVGKTRLALRVADDLLDGSGEEVWFVDLAPLADARLVPSKVASTLGVSEEPGRPVRESLVAALKGRRLLVVLDNCEHVIGDAAALVDELARDCPHVAILSTSREPLRVAGEHVYRVPSLSVPDADEEDPDVLLGSEAVRLLLARAGEQDAGFAVDPVSAPVVGRLCRQLDGIPLAIELAAARLRSLSLIDLERRLDQRLRLLTGGSRVLPRQQTLEALIDWSYELLDSREQQMLGSLSVFAGGFDLEAAEAVTCRTTSSLNALDGLTALVDKSLVETDRTVTLRYRLLESVRQYAANKLLAQGEAAMRTVRIAHRDHYAALAETAAPHLIGHGQLEWLDRVYLDLDNFRAAIAQCLEDPEPGPGLRLSTALCYFWNYREPTSEGAVAICAALDRADAQAQTLVRGKALSAASTLLPSVTGDYDAAIVRGEEALSIATLLGDRHLRAEALLDLAYAEGERGNMAARADLASEALGLVEPSADPHTAAEILMTWASSFQLTDAERVHALEECLDLCRRAGNQVLYARALGSLGYDEMLMGHVKAARTLLEEGLRLVRGMADRRGVAGYTCNLGFAAYLDNSDTEARELFNESYRTARRNGDLTLVAYAQLGLALLASRAGTGELAAKLHGAADATHEGLGTRVQGVESRLREADLSRLRTRLGDSAFNDAYSAGRATPDSETLEFSPGLASDSFAV